MQRFDTWPRLPEFYGGVTKITFSMKDVISWETGRRNKIIVLEQFEFLTNCPKSDLMKHPQIHMVIRK